MSGPTNLSALSACAAVLIAPNDDDMATLRPFADGAGFGAVYDFRAPGTYAAANMPYYILHPSIPDMGKARFIKVLRSSDDLKKKFAPIILYLPRGPAHQGLFYIEMGFDDVMFMTDDQATTRNKLLQQLGREVIFVQTGSYFGPDRRRMERIKRDDPRRKPGGSVHRRLSVVRDPVNGLKIEDRP